VRTSNAANSLGDTVKAVRPMVPAKDYETSKRFYLDLGFRPRRLSERLFEMQLGTFSFILQDYYVERLSKDDRSRDESAERFCCRCAARSLNAASRKRSRFRSPSAVDFRMRSASVV
jgi:hypothetical protein